MTVTIQNERLTVEIEALGAQLASIRTPDGTEYLWQGDPDIWPRRAPLLFPVIGWLKDSTYLLEGVPYTIPQHGFARDMEFAVAAHSPRSATFRITDTPETRAVYPFSFALEVTYTLEEDRLVKAHRVENRSDREMLYELGGHDGFRAPLEPGAAMDRYAIRWPGSETVRPYGMDGDCLLTPKGGPIPLEGGRLPLKPARLGLDTLVFDAPQAGVASLVDDWGRPRVTLTFPDFPYLGIWTQDRPFDTGYVCIEPWSSLPDAAFVGRELGDKAGIRRLAPGQSETLTYTTTICHRRKEG